MVVGVPDAELLPFCIDQAKPERLLLATLIGNGQLFSSINRVGVSIKA
jgi:hypothetical protein